VLDPIGTVPLFIGITQNMKQEERKAVSKMAIITSGIVLVVFATAGTGILESQYSLKCHYLAKWNSIQNGSFHSVLFSYRIFLDSQISQHADLRSLTERIDVNRLLQ
jgi:hypothetical protein